MALSVVVPAIHGESGLDLALKSVREQTLAVGGEVVVALSDPSALSETPAGVRVVEVPGGDILAVRAAGVSAARGEIVALTEDHATVESDWVARTLDAHGRHPDAAAVGGPVDNGSRTSLMDWASFLMNFGPFVPPFTAAQCRRAPAAANLSLKRSALPPDALAPGELEFHVMPRLVADGRIAHDLAPRVVHHKSASFFRTPWLHFQNGRLSSAMASAGTPWKERRLHLDPRRLLQLMVDAVTAVRSKPLPWRARASLPLLLLLCCAHAAGEWTGAVLGAGASADHLEEVPEPRRPLLRWG